MQSVCKVRSRLEGFLGPFFLATAGILATGPQRHDGSGGTGHHEASRGLMAAQASMAAQDITRLHEASRGLMAAQDITAPLKASRGFMAAQGITAPLKASRGLMASPGAPQRPGVRRASLELHSQAAHFGPGT